MIKVNNVYFVFIFSIRFNIENIPLLQLFEPPTRFDKLLPIHPFVLELVLGVVALGPLKLPLLLLPKPGGGPRDLFVIS